MTNTLFKDLNPGSRIYALVKKDAELQYFEGSIITVGPQRLDMPQMQSGQIPMSRSVVDVTYSIDGKNYTDAVDITASMFPTEKLGAITLVTTEKEAIIRELRATLSKAEDYLKSVEVEVPRNEKRVDDCKALIGLLDTEFAEKQEFDNRLKKLEDSNKETNKLLTQILNKLK